MSEHGITGKMGQSHLEPCLLEVDECVTQSGLDSVKDHRRAMSEDRR